MQPPYDTLTTLFRTRPRLSTSLLHAYDVKKVVQISPNLLLVGLLAQLVDLWPGIPKVACATSKVFSADTAQALSNIVFQSIHPKMIQYSQ